MALGVKYRLDYDDEQLISWRADILQEGFAGSITAVKMGGTPVMLEMRDIDDPFTPVCHTEATLALISESLGQFDEFKTADVYEYVLQLERDSTLFWQGTLLTEPFTEAFESAPYEISLKFSDGISELSYERYNVSGALQAGFPSVIDILVKCFNKLPISRGFREIINLFEDNMDDADTEGLLEQLVIYEPAFWETDNSDDKIKGEPALKVIEGIMYSLKCRLVVSQDTYYIIRIAEAKTMGTVKYVDYNSSGTVTGNGTIDLRKSTSGRTEVLPDLLAHLSGATIDINKQYQEVEFIYSSKNITTINNALLINAYFNGGYELQNGSPVPLYYGRSSEVNTVLGATPSALHLDAIFVPFESDTTGEGTDETNTNILVMEDALLTNTEIEGKPVTDYNGEFLASLNPDIPPTGIPTSQQVVRETYYLFSESPADNTVTYKNLLYSTDDHIEITIAGWFDYTYADGSLQTSGMAMMFNKWTIKLGANYYNTGHKTWSTDTKSRVWDSESGQYWTDEVLEYSGGGVKKRRHIFNKKIIIGNFISSSTDDLEITWFIPENVRAGGTISEVEIVFKSMEIKYISDASTEFSIQKVLGETESTSLRTRRYKSEVKHGDGPSNFSVMSFRLPTTNLVTSLWSSRGGSESLPGYKWDIQAVFENLGDYRIIFNGELYGLLEMHNIVFLVQETTILLIKGMRFDTKHNIYELKLHEVASFTPPIIYLPQFNLSEYTVPPPSLPNIGLDPITATQVGFNTHVRTITDSNTETQSYTQSTHVQTNNDTSETAGDYPVASIEFSINFNENDTNNVYDFSTNARNSTSVVNLTTSTDMGAYPYAGRWGVFNGTSTQIRFGKLDLSTNTFSIFTRFGISDSQEHILCYQSGVFELRINASDQVVFKITISTTEYTLTTTDDVSDLTNPTICAVYDGESMAIYIDGIISESQAQTGTIDSSLLGFIVGSDLVSFAYGEMEIFSIYTQALSSDNITALHQRTGGVLLNLADSSKYSLGDLLEVTDGATTSEGVLVNDIGSDQVLYLPISGGIPTSLNLIRHRGNTYNTARQFVNQQQIINGSPEFLIQDGVNSFAPGEFVNNRVQISKATIAQDNIDLLKLTLLDN